VKVWISPIRPLYSCTARMERYSNPMGADDF
jgi:hypothetical protein